MDINPPPHKITQQMPALQFNPDDYRQYLESEGLTPEQEEELLKSLWIIISIFIDLGFGIDPVQLLLDEWAQEEDCDDE